MTEPMERFYAIRRTDGEPVDGDMLSWISVDGPNDWTFPMECEHDDPTEYEIVEMVVHPVAKRTFGEHVDYGEDDE